MERKQLTELLFALLPSLFILIGIIMVDWIIMADESNQMILIVKNAFSPIIFLLLIMSLVLALIGLMRYYRWLSGKSPACPYCGSMMKVRTAKRSKYRGQQFWGCSRYFISGCKGKIHIG